MNVAVDITSERPLSGGFYTAAEASRILGLSGPNIVRSWLGQGKAAPTLLKQYADTPDVGFWDLMEIRFINYFRNKGVSLQHLRKVAVRARHRFDMEHPFALSNVRFKTDRKTIFAEISSEENSKQLEEMVTGQLSLYEVVEDFLADGVIFDPSSGLAKSWAPFPKNLPSVILDPKIAHGQPSVKESRIPTSTLFLNCKAEDFNYSATADWFETTEDFVREAVEYELRLDA
jgi:uncharacterized protein (DUF433 family)